MRLSELNLKEGDKVTLKKAYDLNSWVWSLNKTETVYEAWGALYVNGIPQKYWHELEGEWEVNPKSEESGIGQEENPTVEPKEIKYDIDHMGILAEPLVEAIHGDVGQLSSSFIWSQTPQGHSYWAKQHYKETPLDTEALKEILRQYGEAQGDTQEELELRLEVDKEYLTTEGETVKILYPYDHETFGDGTGRLWYEDGSPYTVGAAYEIVSKLTNESHSWDNSNEGWEYQPEYGGDDYGVPSSESKSDPVENPLGTRNVVAIEAEDFPFEATTDYNPHDSVNSPSHYNNGGTIECIEYIKDFLTTEEYIGYLRGNIAKYMHRFPYKNGIEDVKKAGWYRNELEKTLEEINGENQ